jgi:hypothetical protein
MVLFFFAAKVLPIFQKLTQKHHQIGINNRFGSVWERGIEGF